MLLVVTDTGKIWNHENPFLEKYKNAVLVVCLNGKKVTNKYECFVSPCRINLKRNDYSLENKRLESLASVGRKLCDKFRDHEDIVFLTDNEPSSIYPYYIAKEKLSRDHYSTYLIHLVALSPLNFEKNPGLGQYRKMLEDLSFVNSLLCYDTNKALAGFDKNKTLDEFFTCVREELGKMMPCFLRGIYKLRERSYFDFTSKRYIPIKSGFNGLELLESGNEEDKEEFVVERSDWLMGEICYLPNCPQSDRYTKEEIEKLSARIDGKKVCTLLREQRIRLAEANNIPFESEDCPSIGACAGTCPKCDEESDYLRECMEKIPKEKRVYPQFDPSEEI